METAELGDLTDKMNPMHSGMLRAMLQMKELPERLVKTYFATKIFLDRIDAPVSPMGLFLIAQQAGYVELDIEEPAAKDDGPGQDKLDTSNELDQVKPGVAKEQFQTKPETAVQPEIPVKAASSPESEPESVEKTEKPDEETEQAQESGEPYSVGQTITVYFDENYVDATYVGKKDGNFLVEIDGHDGHVEITPEQIEDDD